MQTATQETNTSEMPVGNNLESILQDPLKVSDGDLPAITPSGGQVGHDNLNDDLSGAAVRPDKFGQSYDPSKHESPPRLNARGAWAALRGKRPTGSPSPGMRIGGAGRGQDTPAPPPVPTTPKYQAEASACVGLFVSGMMMLLGEDWLPDEKRNEMQGMIEGVRLSLEQSGQDVKLPWYAPMIGVAAAYAIPRFPKPKTRDRFNAIVGGVRKWWAKTVKAPETKMVKKAGEEAAPVTIHPKPANGDAFSWAR